MNDTVKLHNKSAQVYSALNMTSLGTVTVQSVDANSKTLTLTGAYPVGTTTGDLLVFNDSPNGDPQQECCVKTATVKELP